MPTLPTRSFATIVSNTVAGIQGRAAALIDFGDGSPLLAIVEAFAGLFIWFQALALQILAASRLSTSTGNDVDTFAADFMAPVMGTVSPRLGQQAATGMLLFSRLTAGPTSCFIPVGATVQSVDGSIDVMVTADPAMSTYSPAKRGYTLAPAVASISVPAIALTPGLAGNVRAGAISSITSPVIGIDTVVNLAAFTGGVDQESDLALKTRFALFILGLSRGDYYGTAAAIAGTNIGVQWTLVESYDKSGSWHPGFYFIVADDGSGAPPDSFMVAVTNAAWSVRPLGIQVAVFPPDVIFVGVVMMITTEVGYDHNTVVGLVSGALANGINSLGLGNDLDFNRLPAWAYAVPGVKKVTDVLLNGASGDGASVAASSLTIDGQKAMPIFTIKTNSVVVS